jgi:DNA-3-methyladenine glycosylase I
MPKRCDWARTDLAIAYHDNEWGVPVHDDRKLFEFLILEGAQAGLSWETILRKRAGYRAAFAGFDPKKVARFDQLKVRQLLANPNIIRNRLKIRGAIQNAQAFLAVRDEFGSFDKYVWRFVNGVTKNRKRGEAIAAISTESDAMSKDLRQRDFRFVGSTICYSFMQAVGMVNDHNQSCFRYREIVAGQGAGTL